MTQVSIKLHSTKIFSHETSTSFRDLKMLPFPSQPLRSALLSLKLQSAVHGPTAAPSLIPAKRHLTSPNTRAFTSSSLHSKLAQSHSQQTVTQRQTYRFASTSALPATPSSPRPAQAARPNPPQPTAPTPTPQGTTTSTKTTPPPDPTLSYAARVTAPSSSPTTTTPSTTSSSPLTWNAYLRLRHIRRRYNQAASAGTALAGGVIGAQVLAAQSLESMGVFGLDPMIGLFIGMAGFLGVGWLAGGSIGGAMFAVTHRWQRGEIAEVSFFF